MKVGLRNVDAPNRMLSDSRKIEGTWSVIIGKIEELREASKVSIEYMFNIHDNCSAEWWFKTRASEEGKTYNSKEDEFRYKKNNNQLYNLLKKTILTFQTDEVLKEVLHMFGT